MSSSHLAQRLELRLHDELIFTELAAAGVGALDPLLKTGLVDEAQAARAVAWRDQGTLVPFTMTDPAGARGRNQWWPEAEECCWAITPANLCTDRRQRLPVQA